MYHRKESLVLEWWVLERLVLWEMMSLPLPAGKGVELDRRTGQKEMEPRVGWWGFLCGSGVVREELMRYKDLGEYYWVASARRPLEGCKILEGIPECWVAKSRRPLEACKILEGISECWVAKSHRPLVGCEMAGIPECWVARSHRLVEGCKMEGIQECWVAISHRQLEGCTMEEIQECWVA